MSTWSLARGPRVAVVLASATILLAGTLGTAPIASAANQTPQGSVLAPIGRLTPVALGPGTPATNHPAVAQPFRTLDPGALRAAKLRAAAEASRGNRGPSSALGTPLAGIFNNLNSPGLNQLTVAPPDSTGAIGPTDYVEMVNQEIGVYDRNLNLLASTDNGTFTGAGAGLSVTDPQIQWDGQSGHWLYAALGVAQGANMLIFGWSKTSDPSDLTNGWCRFGTARGNLLDDYPKLGHDDNFISIGTNVYDDTTAPNYKFLTANIFAFRKPAPGDTSCTFSGSVLLVADAAHPLHNADGSIAFTPVPANTADASPFGYIVAAHSPVDGTGSSAPKIMVWHWALLGGSPSLVADGEVTVPTFGIPAPVPQPGTSYTLDSLDARLTQAVAVNDPGAGGGKGIWTQHTVDGPGGRSVVRWYEILGGTPPTLRQHGDVGSPTDFVFNGAVSPSIGGDSAAVFYNRGGPSTLPVIGAETRSASTPLDSLDAGELLIAHSSAADLDFTCSSTAACRWGDYAGASPDPLNAGVVWGSSQTTGSCSIFCGLFAQWQTQNFAVTASSGATSAISLAKSASPTTYNAVGQTITYTYTITNTGNVSLASAQYTVSDDHIGSPLGTAFNCGSPVALAPQGSVSCTKSYLTSQADLNAGSVTNRATASGAGLTSNQASATATASVSSAISLAKSASPTTYNAVGQTITYTYTITNTGNVSLASAQYTVADDHIGSPLGTGFNCGSPVALAPQGTVSCTKSYLTSQADLNAGSVTNRATASGAGLTSNQASATATASVTPPSAPQNLTAAPAKSRGVQLAWQTPSSTGSSPISGYNVYRGTGSNPSSFGLVATLGVVTSYKDTSTARGSTYTYYVVAVSAAGTSPSSNRATTTAR